MEIRLITTEDGSHTLYSESIGDSYHSRFGALAESEFIFIEQGLKQVRKKGEINIFEVGFGTGLNALLTCCFAKERRVKINYTAVEKYPLYKSIYSQLNYGDILSETDAGLELQNMHAVNPGEYTEINPYFILRLFPEDLLSYKIDEKCDLVYFDAFSPSVQPELWTEEVFLKIYNSMNKDSLLVTYSSKGSVRRALKGAGFNVVKIPGPLGKREITRAIKQ